MRSRVKRPDPYTVLGLRPGATRAEIRRAYRQRAMESHPDVAGADATERMAQINDAREALLSGSGAGSGGPGDAGHAEPRRPAPPPRERPAWADAHESAWTDHWSAWNELPRRD